MPFIITGDLIANLAKKLAFRKKVHIFVSSKNGVP